MAKRRTVSATHTAGLLLVAVAWALLLSLSGSPEVILFTVPVFLLAAPLALESYIGEEILAGFCSRPKRVFRGCAPGVWLTDGQVMLASQTASKQNRGRAPPLAAC